MDAYGLTTLRHNQVMNLILFSLPLLSVAIPRPSKEYKPQLTRQLCAADSLKGKRHLAANRSFEE